MSADPWSHADCPKRDHMDIAGITWRHGGKPDYTTSNKTYLAERTRKHEPGSLEKTVENLVKTWEMEASHKVNPSDWRTVNKDRYVISANNDRKFTIEEVIKKGTYNMLMNDSPMYDAASETFESSHNKFKHAFPDAFCWEVLEVQAGPPKVTCTWRHWGTFKGAYNGREPTGEVIELTGSMIATVDANLSIEEIKIFYDPNPFIAKLSGIPPGGACPAQFKGNNVGCKKDTSCSFM